ncbi:unnamed protein product [Leuciscus chuanchicus]
MRQTVEHTPQKMEIDGLQQLETEHHGHEEALKITLYALREMNKRRLIRHLKDLVMQDDDDDDGDEEEEKYGEGYEYGDGE